ncbi:hypothetical protein BU23DRAFT_634608, partial [Bimuria novae-zelandiae CBS 107.79]
EVLVHIATPATRANDDLYQSLAEAYLDFEPHVPRKDPTHDEALPQSITAGMDHQSSQKQAPESDSALPTIRSMDSYGSFPSHVTSGQRSSDPNGFANSEAPSSPEDVSMSRLERLERIQTKWKEQKTPKSSLANSRRKSNSAFIILADDSVFIDDTQKAFEAIESQLLDDWSVTSEEEAPAQSQPDVPPHIPADVSLFVNPARQPETRIAHFVNPTPERPVDMDQPTLNVVTVEKKARPPSSQHSVVPVNTNSRDTSELSHLQDLSHSGNFQELLTIVSPPSVEITMESPGTLPSQVTSYLENIKQQNPERFKPKTAVRKLDADERGHWRVDSRL